MTKTRSLSQKKILMYQKFLTTPSASSLRKTEGELSGSLAGDEIKKSKSGMIRPEQDVKIEFKKSNVEKREIKEKKVQDEVILSMEFDDKMVDEAGDKEVGNFESKKSVVTSNLFN